MKHPLLGVGGRGCIMLYLSNSQKRILPSCVAFHNVFVLGKGHGRGCRKRDKLERSHFFSVTISRLQGRLSQWVVHGDTPSRKYFNYGLLACVQEGAGYQRLGDWSKAFNWPDSEKGIPVAGVGWGWGLRGRGGGGHKVITIIKNNYNNTGVGLWVVHKQEIPSVRNSC